LTAAARTAELNARDLAGAEKALYLAEAAYEAAPEDSAARQVYAQALRKNAFMQKGAQVRNYYLYVAFHLEQSVTDFAVLGDENTDLAFSAAEFSAHFIGISGATLDTVQILTLPPAEHGVLMCSFWPCHPGEALRVSAWPGPLFIPTSDWNGETSFTWNGASGGNNAAQPATVTITIAPLNDAPVVSSPLPDVTVDEDALSATVDLSTAFTDAEGDPLSYTVHSSNPALVSATLDGATLTLDFQAEQNGTVTITVSAADEAGEYGGVWATDDFIVTRWCCVRALRRVSRQRTRLTSPRQQRSGVTPTSARRRGTCIRMLSACRRWSRQYEGTAPARLRCTELADRRQWDSMR
jgi:hypothetical protein